MKAWLFSIYGNMVFIGEIFKEENEFTTLNSEHFLINIYNFSEYGITNIMLQEERERTNVRRRSTNWNTGTIGRPVVATPPHTIVKLSFKSTLKILVRNYLGKLFGRVRSRTRVVRRILEKLSRNSVRGLIWKIHAVKVICKQSRSDSFICKNSAFPLEEEFLIKIVRNIYYVT